MKSKKLIILFVMLVATLSFFVYQKVVAATAPAGFRTVQNTGLRCGSAGRDRTITVCYTKYIGGDSTSAGRGQLIDGVGGESNSRRISQQ